MDSGKTQSAHRGIVALRRQQTEQVIALQKKIVSISKEIHRMHSEAGE